MKRKIFAIFLVVIVALTQGCYLQKTPDGVYYHILVIEDCQYVQAGGGISHKGNCTNNIHFYNRQLTK